MTEDGLFVCHGLDVNIWDDEWGEQGEDLSGGGEQVTGRSRHGIFFVHDVEEAS
jgi:hypothetical protein